MNKFASKNFCFETGGVICFTALVLVASANATAVELDLGDTVSGNVDMTLSYGATIRTENADKADLVPGFESGGLNYSSEARVPDKGDLASQVLRVTAEAGIEWENFGFIGSASYQYDTEIMSGDAIDPADGSDIPWDRCRRRLCRQRARFTRCLCLRIFRNRRIAFGDQSRQASD